MCSQRHPATDRRTHRERRDRGGHIVPSMVEILADSGRIRRRDLRDLGGSSRSRPCPGNRRTSRSSRGTSTGFHYTDRRGPRGSLGNRELGRHVRNHRSHRRQRRPSVDPGRRARPSSSTAAMTQPASPSSPTASCGEPGRHEGRNRSTICGPGTRTLPTCGVGIGHTRWATHGTPTRDNAHPHLDCTGRLALVHNGIIENHDELAERLRRRAMCSSRRPDSEVLCHLIEAEMAQGASLSEGTAAGSALRPRCLRRRRRPCRRARPDRRRPADFAPHRRPGRGAAYLASDIPALLGTTRQLFALEG